MKQIITILVLYLSFAVSAQENVLVVYVDASSSKDKINDLQNDVQKVIGEKLDYRILLYISNGKNPSISTENPNIEKIFRNLKKGFISSPDLNFDVMSLNNLMVENNYISNISNISKNEGLNYEIEIHFFINEEVFERNNNEVEKKLVDAFLFSNRLKYKQGNQENCTLVIHKI